MTDSTLKHSSARPRTAPSALTIARTFVRRVNAHDVDALCDLMTPQHRFIDPTGVAHTGRDVMREGWAQYFSMFPDYRICVGSWLVSRNRVAFFGSTSATYARNSKSVAMHAAWLALIRGSLVAEWRVYADNEPARAAIRG